MRKNIIAAALASTVMIVPQQALSAVLGENGAQISGGVILSRWRMTYTTDQTADTYLYGFMGAAVDGNSWSSTAIAASAAVSQIINAYCTPGDWSFLGSTGRGEQMAVVSSTQSLLYLSSCSS